MSTVCATLSGMKLTAAVGITLSNLLKILNSHLQVTELIALSFVKWLNNYSITPNIWQVEYIWVLFFCKYWNIAEILMFMTPKTESKEL